MWFRNRKQTTTIGICASAAVENNHGIPQGSVMGPLSFIIFFFENIADSTNCSEKIKSLLGIIIGNSVTKLMQHQIHD